MDSTVYEHVTDPAERVVVFAVKPNGYTYVRHLGRRGEGRAWSLAMSGERFGAEFRPMAPATFDADYAPGVQETAERACAEGRAVRFALADGRVVEGVPEHVPASNLGALVLLPAPDVNPARRVTEERPWLTVRWAECVDVRPLPEATITTRGQLTEARAQGREAGRAAGSWAADGNTDPAHARRVLAMLGDGYPEAWDHLPRTPNLSGEFADDPTPRALAEDIGGDADALAEAWEGGVCETFESACVAELRAVAGDAA